MRRKIIFTMFCALMIILCISSQSYGKSRSLTDVTIDISMAKQEFSINEPIEVTVNISNKGTMTIFGSGYCFTFLLEGGNTIKELFCPYNTSMGFIMPGENYVETIKLHEYSSDIDNWGKIGHLPEGEYTLKAVYGSETNPWYDEFDVPYNETMSEIVQFKVGSNVSNNSDNTFIDWLLTYFLPLIIIIIILASVAYIWRRKKGRTNE